MIYWLDLIGTFVFAISGALAAWDKKMYHDIFGVSFTAFVTSIGGGTMRDLILGVRPVWVGDVNYIVAIALGVLVTVLFRARLLRFRRSVFMFDTIGIGFYTVICELQVIGKQVTSPGNCRPAKLPHSISVRLHGTDHFISFSAGIL